MRVVLQNIETLQFVSAKGSWTGHATEARDFGELPRALDYVLKNGLRNARVVFKGLHPGTDLELPPVLGIQHAEAVGGTEL